MLDGGCVHDVQSGLTSLPAQPSSKLRNLLQILHALLNVSTFHSRGFLQTETFATETRGHAAVDHRAPDVPVDAALGRGEIAHESAHEAVARARRVADIVQRIGRADEETVRAGEDGTVRTLFDDDVLRPIL